MRKLSQTALYGEVLTSEQLYRREVGHIVLLTDEQQHALLERLRAGDREARSEMVCNMLPLLLSLATRFARVAVHADLMDLCQMASLEVLEVLDKALETARPFAYLMGVASITLVRYLKMADALIVKTSHQDFDRKHHAVASLDMPVEWGSELTYADVLADESSVQPDEPCAEQYEALYRGIETLTDFQRVVIERRYGLYGRPQEMLCDIDFDLTGKRDRHLRVACGRHHKAMCALRRQLEWIA